MQVKKRLQLNAALSVIAAAAILLVLFLAMYRVFRAVEASDIADKIITGAFERVTLRNDYVHSGNERARVQWFSKHEQIGRLLKSAAENFRDPADQKTVAKLMVDQESIGRIFSAIVKNREKVQDSAEAVPLLLETEKRLTTQLNMRSYSGVLQARSLQASSQEAFFSALRLAGWGIAGVLVLVMATAIGNAWMMGRSITERIQRLRNGAAMIGGGNLEHRIEVRGDDEFAELSRAFNAMAEKLHGSYRALESEITERRRAETELRESEKRHRNLFETMTEGVALHEIVCDEAGQPRDYRFLEVNPAFERQTGLKAADIPGRTLYEVLPQAEGIWVERYGAVALTGQPTRFDHWSKALGRHFEVSAFQTEPGRFAVMFLDVTERKRAEQALAEHAAQLEEVNRELETFNYSASHDLRTPLRAITTYAQLILKKQGEQFDAETRWRFQRIRDNAETMGWLIDDLLAFSRLGRQAVAKRSFDMEELIGEVWQELLALHPDREMTLEIGPLPAAWGDRTMIRQVYGNLLGNAVKFTQGRDKALIEAGSYVQDNETVYYVRDNGIGFDMKLYDKLFRVFQRLHSTDEYEGTGIGLALVQRIVHRHGGRVWAEGKVDEGACFYFTLPEKS